MACHFLLLPPRFLLLPRYEGDMNFFHFPASLHFHFLFILSCISLSFKRILFIGYVKIR